MNELYSDLAAVYEAMYATFIDYELEYNFYSNILKKWNKKSVLEIGSGTGNLTAYFEKNGFEYYGLDLSEEMLAIAIKKNPNSILMKGDMRSFELKNVVQSILITGRTISYLRTNTDVNATFSSIHDNLEKGGLLCFDFIDASRFIPDIRKGKEVTHEATYKGISYLRRSTWNIDVCIPNICSHCTKRVVKKTASINQSINQSIMKTRLFLVLILAISQSCTSPKNENTESVKKAFLEEQTSKFGISINKYLNNNTYALNSLNQSSFTSKIDSLKNIYLTHLNTYEGKLHKSDFNNELLAINSYLHKFILEYPQKHTYFTGEKIILSKTNQSKIDKILPYFDDSKQLEVKELTMFIESYISIKSRKKLNSNIYNGLNNQQLTADWNTINSLFKNQETLDYWKQYYLYKHINNMGIKNIEKVYTDFSTSCKNSEYKVKIQEIYENHKKGRASHLIETYKKVNGFELDMHIFLPNPNVFKGNRPTIVQFHGGSWSTGKPDWFFSTAESYAKQGWVVGVVEYRIKGKQETYPFEAVKDAKSAIRWIRENAEKYNIDPHKIVATGNSAGGHLAIATTLVDNWNESTDNIEISPKPNTIIVNAAVYDLTTNANRWITGKMQNRDIAKEISPNHLLKTTSTKMLLIHGNKDRNCPYETAKYFYNQMNSLGNDIELRTINDASHFIWYGKHAAEVSNITQEFIEKLQF